MEEFIRWNDTSGQICVYGNGHIIQLQSFQLWLIMGTLDFSALYEQSSEIYVIDRKSGTCQRW